MHVLWCKCPCSQLQSQGKNIWWGATESSNPFDRYKRIEMVLAVYTAYILVVNNGRWWIVNGSMTAALVAHNLKVFNICIWAGTQKMQLLVVNPMSCNYVQFCLHWNLQNASRPIFVSAIWRMWENLFFIVSQHPTHIYPFVATPWHLYIFYERYMNDSSRDSCTMQLEELHQLHRNTMTN